MSFRRTPNREQRRAQKVPQPKLTLNAITKKRTELRDFAEIDAFMQQLESDCVEEAGGLIVRTASDGEQYSVLHALLGWCEFWRALANKLEEPYDDTALTQLIKKLDYNMPLTLENIRAAKAVVEAQRDLYRNTPNSVINTLAQQVRVRVNLEDALA